MIARPEDFEKNITFKYDRFVVSEKENAAVFSDISYKVRTSIATSITISDVNRYSPNLVFQQNLSVCRIGYLHNVQNIFLRNPSSYHEELSDRIYNCVKQIFRVCHNMNAMEFVMNSGFYKDAATQAFLKRFAIADVKAMPFAFHGGYNVTIQILDYFLDDNKSKVILETYLKEAKQDQKNLKKFNKIYEQQQEIRNTKKHSIATEGS